MTLSRAVFLVVSALSVEPLHALHGLRGQSSQTKIAIDGRGLEANPLLNEVGLMPALAKVRAEHVKPAMEARLKTSTATFKQLEKDLRSGKVAATYDTVMLPMTALNDDVGHPWNFVMVLKSVKDSAEIRAAVEAMQPKVVAFGQMVSQSKPIYEAVKKIHDSAAFADFPESRKRIVTLELLGRKLGGVGLDGDDAKTFNSVQQKLSDLSTTYSNTVIDAQKAFNVTLTDKARVQGIPQRTLEAAALNAKAGGFKNATAESGPWVLTLDGPLIGPVLTYADDRALREQMMRAYATLAAKAPHDNTNNVAMILENRQKQANLLGYNNYAELSLASKMATLSQVHALLGKLQDTAKPAARQDEKDLEAFAHKHGHTGKLDHWDRPYYTQKLQQEKYGIDQEALRAYFPYPTVLSGVFNLCQRLFGVEIKRNENARQDDLWDPNVLAYTVWRDGQPIGYLMLDPYSRQGQKRAGAWAQPMISRQVLKNKTQLPVAGVVTNFPSPPGDNSTPSLLSMGEVSTLFHEFGHAMQHVLTTQNESAVSGINGVEWDAVEVASQFMEYWTEFDKRTLYSFAKHYKTGEPLPEATYKQLEEAQTFRSGTGVLSQVFLGKIDLTLHEKYVAGEDTHNIENQVVNDVLVVPPLPESRRLCSFNHIFSGGYAAGYYSYQWSKVLSADAFSAFEEGGALSDDTKARTIGRKFANTFMALGGGRPPADVFAAFRGRAPQADALLRYSGLVAKP